MWKWFITAVAWVGLTYPIYLFLPRWWLVVYALVTLGGLLLWAGLRKSKPKTTQP
jgi:hypothetical protein